jgi:type II pantothenate kinase
MSAVKKPRSDDAPAAGVDVGSSLVKLALRDASGGTRFESLPSGDLDAVALHLRASGPGRIALTGGGAPRLARLLQSDTADVGEFDAWALGARRMLEESGENPPRFLLVSVGTGTSALLVEHRAARRVGGTALGGGTIHGLGRLLAGVPRFEEIAALARQGDRRRVDLLIRDVYPEGGFLLPAEVNAASFARLTRQGEADTAKPADLAQALMGLVGENVALICCGLAAAQRVERIVFGGTTLRDNPALVEVLRLVCLALGRQPTFLPRGEYTGALGALEHLAARDAPEPQARP